MPRFESIARSCTRWLVFASWIGAFVATGILGTGFAWAVDEQPSRDVLMTGAELFAREWLPQDSKGSGSDGLGPVYNYSDLLLHDMGSALSDAGSYYGVSELGSSARGVNMHEWRTPPLWGFRESGPYLHDGRAKNLEEAVALHGGESTSSTTRFFRLLPEQRLQVQAFLRSLAARAIGDRQATDPSHL